MDGHFGRLLQWLKKIKSYQNIPDVFKLKDLLEKEETPTFLIMTFLIFLPVLIAVIILLSMMS